MRINDNGVDRDMSPQEEAAYRVAAQQAAEDQMNRSKVEQAVENAKASAKAKLAALGLTDAEITALLGA